MTEHTPGELAATARRRLRRWTPAELDRLRARLDRPAPRPRALWLGAVLVSAGAAAAVALALRPSDPARTAVTVARAPQPVVQPLDDDRVDLGPGSFATPRTRDTRLQVRERTARRLVVALHAGGARFQVRHDPARLLVVEAAGVTVEDLGTSFTVERTADGVKVAVSEGRVAVRWGGQVAELGAGQEGSYRPGRPTAPAPAPAAVEPAESADDLLAAGDEARASGDSARATALLARFVARYPRDPRSAAAAFTRARLLDEKLGKQAEAARAYEEVVRLAPGGALAEEALGRSVLAWSAAGKPERARAALGRLRTRFPRAARLPELERQVPGR